MPAEVLKTALDVLDPDVRAALEETIRRARIVHEDQRRTDTTTQVAPGGTVTERWLPVDRVGLYVPGGVAVYPSSVVMNVVPAQIAGVASIAVTSPPQRDNTGLFAGYPDPTILAACELLGIDEVYAVGGAQAIAMFAYGAREPGVDGTPNAGAVVCEPVALVTGPGNIYVAAAKRLLKGVIGIDAEAGPTEIAVLADDSADPEHVAADLISQAEHDTLAASVLVTDSEDLALRVKAALVRRVAATKHTERVTAALAGRQSGVVLVDDIEAAITVVNAYAAEHLEIQTRDARGGGPADPKRRGDLRGSLCAGEPGRLLRRLQPRAAHRWLRLPQQRAVRAVVPARHPCRGLHRRPPCAMSPTTWSPWPAPRTCPPTARPSSPVSGTVRVSWVSRTAPASGTRTEYGCLAERSAPS